MSKKLIQRVAVFSLGIMGLVPQAGATLTNFTDYGLSSVKASWDIFYGANYLPVFEFEAGTAGNPILNYVDPLELRATVTTWMPGPPSPATQQATGPIGSGGLMAGVPGDREQFYTFFAGNIDWDITGTVPEAWETFVFQMNVSAGSGSSVTNVRLNGAEATSSSFDSGTGYGVWQWSGVGLGVGDSFSVTWNTGTHTGFDAFQIQAGVVPEPGVWAMIAIAGLGLVGKRILRSRRNHG
ncbi:MAG: hypothetical protein Fur0032_12850 [Terrimicrobiaceae bacterium]